MNKINLHRNKTLYTSIRIWYNKIDIMIYIINVVKIIEILNIALNCIYCGWLKSRAFKISKRVLLINDPIDMIKLLLDYNINENKYKLQIEWNACIFYIILAELVSRILHLINIPVYLVLIIHEMNCRYTLIFTSVVTVCSTLLYCLDVKRSNAFVSDKVCFTITVYSLICSSLRYIYLSHICHEHYGTPMPRFNTKHVLLMISKILLILNQIKFYRTVFNDPVMRHCIENFTYFSWRNMTLLILNLLIKCCRMVSYEIAMTVLYKTVHVFLVEYTLYIRTF